ncbi:MAG TPA: JAB domain-containing protein [Armatimonadota bacterium]|nr:JAB domain-containing protein [Armatimonadota bacterium]
MEGLGCIIGFGIVIFLIVILWPLWLGLGIDAVVRHSINARLEAKHQGVLKQQQLAAGEFSERVATARRSLSGKPVASRLLLLNAMSALLEPIHYVGGIEGAVCIYFDSGNRVLDIHHWVGDDNSVPIPTDTIVAHALATGSHAVAIAHNHPNNNSVPSDRDVWHAAELIDALQAAGIGLVEDYVWCHNRYKSVLKTRRFKDLVRPV